MTHIVGVDVGGTFTDAFAADDSGVVVSAKAPTTPADRSIGVLNSLRELSRLRGMPLSELLADTAYVAHGTTATINALVTHETATTGFITTRGHRDSIYIMNLEGRYSGLSADEIQDVTRTRKPLPLVSKRLVREVTERIDRYGDVVVPLDEAGARTAIRELIAEGIEGIAVSLLWSFRDGRHERRIRELIRQEDPSLYVALSSEVSPRIREFARNSTTLMSAQVGPTLRRYLEPLEERLRAEGLRGPLLVMQGSGGTVSAAEAPRHAITTIGSVLSGGVAGAARLATSLGHRDVISTDVGGTTFLVGLIVDGEPLFSTSTVLNQHVINVPMVKVNAIGSGGGAIASIDAGGNLRVGPRSAGADPGPASYGQGGTEPTVTDAALLLGILSPGYFLGGRKTLDRDRAATALDEHVGRPLGLDAVQAAAAVFTVQNAQTADLVRKVVVEAGHDPRDFAMYAFGGAGPMHCAAYGADLGIAEIVVPLGSTAAGFSAYGLATSDVRVTAEVSDPADHPVPPERVAAILDRLQSDVAKRLGEQGVSFSEVVFRREVDIRYTAQMAEVSTPVPDGPIDEAAIERTIATFEEKYSALFGVGSGFREAGFQLMTYRVHGIGRMRFTADLPELPPGDGSSVDRARKGDRDVFLDVDRGFETTPVYAYDRLGPGDALAGPAIVEAPTTTVVVPRGMTGSVDRLGNLVLTRDGDL
jgi:N-methylhydantoinase A